MPPSARRNISPVVPQFLDYQDLMIIQLYDLGIQVSDPDSVTTNAVTGNPTAVTFWGINTL